MISYYQHLGERIERAWLERSCDEEVFSPLAQEALEQDPPTENVEVADIVDWAFATSHPFRQPHRTYLFGEPPVLLFQSARFYIEALFWLSGTTTIHEHPFSGVFAVLSGSSVHNHWRFVTERVINSRMLCGQLERVHTEILQPGTMRPIHAGDRLIHQLFHLDLPSVTIVVRTYGERSHLPQYSYLLPGLAIDREEGDELRRRRLIFLDGMARGQIDGLKKYAMSVKTIGFEFNDQNRLSFRSLVEGLDTDGLLQRLRSEFQEDSINAHRDRLLDAKQLARSDLFHPLFLGSPLREARAA